MQNSKTVGEIKDWLTARISKALRVRANEIDPDAPLARYGLQSIDAVILAMEIEEEIGAHIEPTLLWEYNTINLCATHLIELVSVKAA
jgi:acyl carrier protein